MSVQVAKEVGEGKTVFTVFGTSGDDRLVWDAEDPNQIKEAIEKFDEYMDKGYLAFLIDARGKQGDQIHPADWKKMSVRQCEEILFKEGPKEVQVVAPVVGG